ncbi:LPS export ABC transporter permease LptF [Curvibacter sp. CHRR-16]|uniref:LPS export ABC transporter permease LptF n=1 Tax=Curvibacter sp. CHRR-16 TaxID=2835872 RepID=UPI001BD95A0B|nr:LPS export ABC transporter permease LptF [Curvibacter sp. CHRR-16]MBT0571230.1 LPS export ABC transporter permease LptF [Curvibacter sp. CHRR-16]
MLFHSSVRKELARSFGGTLVVLSTVVMTMTLLRTVGDASRGTFNPADVLLIMGYTVLSDMPTILTLSLFIGILSMLTRMYRDSEMVIWFGSGAGLARVLPALLRFAWPVILMVAGLAIVILPWAFSRIEDLRFDYEKRGDIARIEPGQFQESTDGSRVFFIEKNSKNQQVGHNVFISTTEAGKETVTTGQKGSIEVRGTDKFLLLDNGQRLERSPGQADVTLTQFTQYGARVGRSEHASRDYAPTQSISTLQMLGSSDKSYQAELSWRFGLPLAAFNLVIIALSLASANPRAGKASNLGMAFLAFVVYFNLLVLGKSWIASAHISLLSYLLLVHGGIACIAGIWLFLRHHNVSWSDWIARSTHRRGGKR